MLNYLRQYAHKNGKTDESTVSAPCIEVSTGRNEHFKALVMPFFDHAVQRGKLLVVRLHIDVRSVLAKELGSIR